MSPRDLLGHGALWVLQLLTGLDARSAGAVVDADGRTVDTLARDLAATTHMAAALVRQRPDDVPPEDASQPAAEVFRAAAADALTAFAECGALNQPVAINDELLDGEALCLRVAALHWRAACDIADEVGQAHLTPAAEALEAAHSLLPGLVAMLPPVPTRVA